MKAKTKKVVNNPKNIQPTQKDLKQAYSLVTQDLFNSLVKAKTDTPVSIGTFGFIGSLIKTEHKMTSGLDKNTYVFYKLRFRASAKLKRELNKALEKKYR